MLYTKVVCSLEEAPPKNHQTKKVRRIQKTISFLLSTRLVLVFRNDDDDDAPDSRSTKDDDDDDGLLLLLLLVVVVYYVVYSTRKFELEKRAFDVEIF